MTIRIAVLDDYQGVAHELADWKAIPGSEVVFFRDTLTDHNGLVERLASFDVIVTTRERTRLPGPVLERLTNLKLISGTGRRQAHVDMETATRLGIMVTGTDGGRGNGAAGASGSGDSTTELAWGLILSATRNIVWEDHHLRQGQWQTRLASGLAGKTLGILGMGRIGTNMAGIGSAFGMHVIAWGPTLTPERASAGGAKYVAWDELFRNSDVLSIHVPLTDLSRGWVTAREIGLMKQSSYFINTARAPIVDTEALVEALRNRQIAGAGLDVYEEEPVPVNHALLALDNVVLTPHLGYATREALTTFMEEAARNIVAWATGEYIKANVIDEAVLEHARR